MSASPVAAGRGTAAPQMRTRLPLQHCPREADPGRNLPNRKASGIGYGRFFDHEAPVASP